MRHPVLKRIIIDSSDVPRHNVEAPRAQRSIPLEWQPPQQVSHRPWPR